MTFNAGDRVRITEKGAKNVGARAGTPAKVIEIRETRAYPYEILVAGRGQGFVAYVDDTEIEAVT